MKNTNKIRQRHDYEKELRAYEEQIKQEAEMLEQMSEEERNLYVEARKKSYDTITKLLACGAIVGTNREYTKLE